MGAKIPTQTSFPPTTLSAARAGTATVWLTGNDRNSLEGAAKIRDQAFARREITGSVSYRKIP